MEMAEKRLGPEAWIRCGLRVLAASGWTALRADTLAKSLGVSRGSFYWHFTDVAAFHKAVLNRWREIAVENVIAEIDPLGPERPEALVRRAFGSRPQLEIAVRAWATVDDAARSAVRAVDTERVAYMRAMLIDARVRPDVASSRANILNWIYLGYALSSGSKAHAKLEAIVTELLRFVRSGADDADDRA